MELNKLSFIPRKRSAFETFDLAMLFTKQHFLKLFTLYLCFVMPVFLLLGLLLDWGWSGLILWWLKPLFERPLLDYFSKVVFNQSATLRSSARSILSLSIGGMLLHLTIYRFSPNRAFFAPVEQLERLKGERKSKRKNVLSFSGGNKQGLWLLFCVHFEVIIMLVIISMVVALIPSTVSLEELYYNQIESVGTWVGFSSNFIYIISIACVAPIFVCGGFMAYLNRRIELEGWDIELIFKSIHSRLTKTVPETLSKNLSEKKASPTGKASSITKTLPVLLLIVVGLFQSPDLQAAEINKDEIRQQVTELYAQDGVIKTESKWNPTAKPKPKQEPIEYNNNNNKDLDFSGFGDMVAHSFWAIAAIFFLLLAYYVIAHKGFFLSKGTNNESQKAPSIIPTLFAEIEQEELPDNPISEAKSAYNQGNVRLALAYLLRYSLTWAQETQQVRLKRSMTEGECLFAINRKLPSQQQSVFELLFSSWIQVAWAHKEPQLDFEQLATDIQNIINNKDVSHEA